MLSERLRHIGCGHHRAPTRQPPPPRPCCLVYAIFTGIPAMAGMEESLGWAPVAPPIQAQAERRVFLRTLIVAVLLIGAIWLVAMSRWILTDNVVPWDSKNQFYAFYRFLASALDAGMS